MPTQIDRDEITKLNKANPEEKHIFQKNFNRILSFVITIGLLATGYFLFLVISTSGKVFSNPDDDTCNNWFCNVKNGLVQLPSIFGKDTMLKGQMSGRTNILLLGVDATGSAGLSDTIMIASLFHNDKKIVTVNIPRDTLTEYKNTRFKINELYGTAEANKPGSGPIELSNFLSKELGIDMHYWALSNFAGAEKAIDLVGGVDIDVENQFIDCEFPTKNYGYLPCQSFSKGIESMDGERALVYARSRHGDNGEGSDFARSKRQSIVVQAILQKVKNQNIFQNLGKFTEIIDLLGKNVKTNMNPSELKSLVNFGKNIDLKTNFMRINWAVGNGFLCDTTDSTLGYYIYYCPDKGVESDTSLNFNGQVMGTRPLFQTKAKGDAQKSIQNLLNNAQLVKIADTEMVILGNGAKSAQKIYTLLSDPTNQPAFGNVIINNYYTKIPVTSTPEKITIYILDPLLTPAIKTKLDESATTIKYSISQSLDPKIVLPAINNDAKVIVWLE
jgi:LCP family protein required for cell wall assembly